MVLSALELRLQIQCYFNRNVSNSLFSLMYLSKYLGKNVFRKFYLKIIKKLQGIAITGFLNILVGWSYSSVDMVACFASWKQNSSLKTILCLKFMEHILQNRLFFFLRWHKNPLYLAVMENSNILKPSYFVMIPKDPQCIYPMLLKSVSIQKTYFESVLGIIAIERKLMNFFSSCIFRFSVDCHFCTIASFSRVKCKVVMTTESNDWFSLCLYKWMYIYLNVRFKACEELFNIYTWL